MIELAYIGIGVLGLFLIFMVLAALFSCETSGKSGRYDEMLEEEHQRTD